MHTYTEGERALPAAKAVCFHSSMNLLHGPFGSGKYFEKI